MERATNNVQTGVGGGSLLDAVSGLLERYSGRPSWDEYFMSTAFLISSRSNCDRLHVGCVLVSSGSQPNRIIAAGYNGFLPGSPHLSRVVDGHEQGTVHAEQNAISDAARRGISVNGATAYVTHFPCVACAKILVSSGVKKIRFYHDYRNNPLVNELLEEAGIEILKLR